MTTESPLRRVIIETPSGERFEADIPCDTKVNRLTLDFFEAQGWPTDQLGQRHQAVVDLVNPNDPDKNKRLNNDRDLCAEGVKDGDIIRIYRTAPTTELAEKAGSLTEQITHLTQELAAQRQTFESRIQGLEKRLDETAASLSRLTHTLSAQITPGPNNPSEQTLTTLSAVLETLAHSLQSQTITFRSLPQTERQTLFQVLRDYFSLGELQELCFALDIPYADLPGLTLTDKARELVAYSQRYGRDEQLKRAVQERRPHLNWE